MFILKTMEVTVSSHSLSNFADWPAYQYTVSRSPPKYWTQLPENTVHHQAQKQQKWHACCSNPGHWGHAVLSAQVDTINLIIKSYIQRDAFLGPTWNPASAKALSSKDRACPESVLWKEYEIQLLAKRFAA